MPTATPAITQDTRPGMGSYSSPVKNATADLPSSRDTAAGGSGVAMTDEELKSAFPGYKPEESRVSPTVISDADIRDNVIPSLQNKAATLQTTPTSSEGVIPKGTTTENTSGKDTGTPTTDQSSNSGSATNNNGGNSSDLDYASIYSKVFGDLEKQPTDPETAQNISLLESMKTSSDSSYAGQVATVQGQYAANRNLLAEAERRNTSAASNALLKTGAYRTSAITTIPQAMRTAQFEKLGALQDKENIQITKIQQAQQNLDYKLMHDEMAELDKVRSEKQSLAIKISTELSAENQKLSAAKSKNAIANAVADEFSSGKTDPDEILKAVTDKGLNITSADVTAGLNTIAKANGMDLAGLSGNVKNFFALKNSGSLPSNISKLPEGDQLKAYLDMEKHTTTKTTAAVKPLYTTAKGQNVTKNDIEAGVQKLDSSKDKDGFVDPKLYQAMYQHWEDEGLPPNEFIKQYPPKYYINPNDKTLPVYMRPTVKGKTATTVHQYGTTATSTPATGS